MLANQQIEKIVNNIEKYVFDNGHYNKIIDGIYTIGFLKNKQTDIEIRYCNNFEYDKQILIDDVWSDVITTFQKQNKKKKILVLYLCHPKIKIKENKITLEPELNLTSNYNDITKYFISLSLEDCKKCSHYSDLFSQEPISFPSARKKNNIISVITSVLNNSRQLEQTIQSVINQSYQEFEYIIKDGGSKDSFVSVIKKYSNYISKIIVQSDNGIYDGMHQGIEISSGQYFGVLNSDDVYKSKNVLSTYIGELHNEPADAYYANILRRNPDGKTYLRKGSLKNIYKESSINHPSLLLKRTFYDKIGGFDLSLKYAADGDLTIKLIKSGCRFKYIDFITTLMRAGGASTLSFRLIIEELICRYRYNKINVFGYLFVVLRSIKNIIKRIL